VEFHAVPSVAFEQCEQNAEHALTLGLASIERAGNVAVVGGGFSLADHLDTLRDWDGPIWAINQSFMWLKGHGIKSTFLTADPRPQPWLKGEKGDNALVAMHGDPSIFQALEPANVRTYRLAADEVHCGCTTATAAPFLAVLLGHRSVSFFGCDSSYEGEGYVFDRALPSDLINVRCGDQVHITKPEFLMQADALAGLCRELPQFHINKSAGLLAALIADPDRKVLGFVREAA
jgi:hypothetical protein